MNRLFSGSRSQRISRRNQRHKPRFRGEHLEDRAMMAVWSGGGGNNLWSNPGNWFGGNVPDTVGETADFTSFTPQMTVNVDGNFSPSAINFTINPASYTLGGTGSINLGFGGSISQATFGANTINAQVSGTNIIGAVSNGTLNFGNTNNVMDSSSIFDVTGGGTLGMAMGSFGSSLGSAQLDLNGGNLNLNPAFAPGLNQGQVGYPGGNSIDQAAANPSTAVVLRPEAGYNQNGFPPPVSGVTGSWGDNQTWIYSGQFFDADGFVSFAEHIDDQVLIRIDGIQRLLNTAWNAQSTTGALNIGMGPNGDGWHDIDIRFGNGGGGRGPTGTGNGGTNWTTTYGFGYDPNGAGGANGDQNQIFQDPGDGSLIRRAIVGSPAANNVFVSGTSNINFNAALPAATLNNLTLNAGSQLNVNGAGQLLTFNGTTNLNGGGTPTINTNTANLTLAGTVFESGGAGNFSKIGAGTLNLNSANSYSGLTTITAGTVVLGNDAALGSEGVGTVISGAGTLNINGRRIGATGNEPITVSGAGVGGNGAIINTGATQTSAARNITLLGNTTFAASSRWDMRDTGGTSTFNMNGWTLTKVGGAEFALVNTTILNPGNVNANAGIFRLEGSTQMGGAGTVTVANGATLDFWNNTQTHTFNTTLNGGGTMKAEGGGGPTVTGTVNLAGTANLVTHNNITLSNQVFGGGGITKSGGGTLFLNNLGNSYGGTTTINAGTIRILNNAGLGTAANAVVNAGGTLDLNGGFNFTKPLLLSGTLNSSGGTNTASGSILLPANATINNSAAAGAGNLFTITSAISAVTGATLSFGGTGDIAVNTSLVNGALSFSNFVGRLFNNATGLGIQNEVGATNINTVAFSGVPTTTTPLNGLLNFPQDSDTAFTNFFGGGLPGGTNFTAAFVGDLNVTQAGTYFFAVSQNDDTSVVWIDTNQNGTFQIAELIQQAGCCNSTGVPGGVFLNPGTYKIAYAMEDTGGGSGLVGRYGAFNPGNATQMPIVANGTSNLNLAKNGAGTVTLNNANTYSGTTLVNQGTLVIANPNALGTTTGGTQVLAGGTLGLAPGVNLNGEALTLNGTGAAGQSGALVNTGGGASSYTGAITGFPIQNGSVGLGSNGGTLTVNGTINLTSSQLVGNGAGNIVVNSNISGAGGPLMVAGFSEKLWENKDFPTQTGPTYNNIESIITTALPPDAQGILTGHLSYPNNNAFQTRALALGSTTWNTNDGDGWTGLWLTSFTPNESGVWQFRAASIDNEAGFWIDTTGVVGVFDATSDRFGTTNGGCCGGITASTPSLVAGQTYYLGIAARDYEGGNFNNLEIKSPSGGFVPLNPSTLPAGMFTVAGTSNNAVVKNGTGTMTLNGLNTYNGTTTVNEGVLVVGNNSALGTSGVGTTVHSGATLGLAPGVNINNGEALALNGTGAAGQSGALVNTGGGASSYTGAITGIPVVNGSVGLGSDGGTLTVNGTLNLTGSQLIGNGAGNIVVNSNISGAGGPVNVAGISERLWENKDFPYQTGPTYDNIELIINTALVPDAQGILTGHLSYANNAAFQTRALALGSSTWNTNDGDGWTGLWLTSFTPNESGVWQFQVQTVDNEAGFWLDTTGVVGVFDAISDRIGNGTCCGGFTSTTPFLTAGQTYYLGIAARDYEGGNFNNVTIKSPSGGFVPLNPSTLPAGMLTTQTASNNQVVKLGTGAMTLGGNNTYNGQTLVNQGTLIATNNNALGSTSAGTTVASGATLGLNNNITLPAAESLVVTGTGVGGGGALLNVGGTNTVAGNVVTTYNGSVGDLTIGSNAGTLVISGSVDLKAANLVVTGAGNVTINGQVTTTNNTIITSATAGLIVGRLPGNPDTVTPNPGNEGVQLGINYGQTNVVVNPSVVGNGAWADNTTFVYTGEVFDADGIFSFAENIDDSVRLRINGIDVINDDEWNVPTSSGNTASNIAAGAGTINFGASPRGDGWYPFELRMSNGGGGAGAVAGNGWAANYGIGFSASGSTSTNGSQYIIPIDNGSRNLFQHNVVLGATANSLTKNGAGTLILAGANNYTGPTTVNGGILRGTQLAAVPTNVTVNSGGTFDTNGLFWNNVPRDFTIAGPGAAGQPGAIINSAGAEGDVRHVTLSGNATIGTNAGKLNIRGTTTGNGNTLTVNGTGETNFRIDNSLVNLPGIIVNTTGGGRLRFESSQSPASPLTVTVNPGSRLDSWATRTYGANLTVALNSGILEANGPGGGFTATYNGPITVSGASSVVTNKRIDFFGQVSGGAGGADTLTKTGTDVLNFRGGAVNSFEQLTINAGRVRFEGTGFGTWTGTINVNTNGILSPYNSGSTSANLVLGGGTLSIENSGTATYNGNVTVNSPSFINTVNAALGVTLNGAISGAGNLTKQNAGTATFNGASPGYSGTVTVSAGTLFINNFLGGSVTVQNGATLGGTGGIGGTLLVQSGGIYTPGLSPADFDAGNLNLNAGSTYIVEINGTTPGTQYDQTIVSGSVTLGGNLSVTSTINPPLGTVFVIIDKTSGGAVSGTFAGLPELAPLLISGQWYHITYVHNGNDVALIRNRAPIADAGNYTISEGDNLPLDGSGSSDPDGDSLTYRWDVDGDGDFDENITGLNPNVSWATLQGLGIDDGPDTRTIYVEVDDGLGGVTVSTGTLNFILNNTPPTAGLSGPTEAGVGQPVDFTFFATDPSNADTAATMTYHIDWGDGSPIQDLPGPSGGLNVTHTYTLLGNYTVIVTASDQDNDTGPAATQGISVQAVFIDVDGNLVSGGLDEPDRIIFSAASGGRVMVRWENSESLSGNLPKTYGPFTLASGAKIIAYGGGGDDTITVSNLTIPVEFHGGDGNDYLAGGTVDDSLFGDAGNDRLLGGYGNDLIDGGDDNDSVDAGYGDDIVFGGSGNDTLLGGVGDDVVSGGDGTDGLTGSNGNDILLGGDGKDSLSGGNDEDVLASGLTAYDSYSAANYAALQALLAEWTSGNSYATRIANLKSGGGAAAGNMLNPASNVTNDDGYNDILKGAAGNDWFLASTAVSGADKDTTDRVIASETLN